MPKNKNPFPQIKKDIKAFLTEEEGSMLKKDVVKVGLGLLVLGLGLKSGMNVNDASAAPCCRCGSYVPSDGVPVTPGTCSPTTHCSHSSHSSY